MNQQNEQRDENKENQGVKQKMKKFESLCLFHCNCNCIMCSVGIQLKKGGIISTDELKKTIKKAKEDGAEFFAFSGGEPTLRKDLVDLVKYAKALGFRRIEIQSNGRMYAYDWFCKLMAESGVDSFVVSLHSHIPEVNDKIMGVKGSFEQTKKGIKNLNKLGFSVKINVVLINLNYQHLKQHTKFLVENFKIEEIRYTVATVTGNCLNNPKKIIAPISKVAPHICEGIDIAKDFCNPLIYGMPPCILICVGKEKYIKYINDLGPMNTILSGPNFVASLDLSKKKNRVKLEECKKCKWNNVCSGLWKEYRDFFGESEIKAIEY